MPAVAMPGSSFVSLLVLRTVPLFRFIPKVLTRARACKHVYKHAVAPPSVSSRGHTVGTGNEFNSRGYLDIDVLSLCTNIRSLIQHQMDKCNARFACGDGESSENIPVRARESFTRIA